MDTKEQVSPIPKFTDDCIDVIDRFANGEFCRLPQDTKITHDEHFHANAKGSPHQGSVVITIDMYIPYYEERLIIAAQTPFDERKISSFNEEVHVVAMVQSSYQEYTAPKPIFQKASANYKNYFIDKHLPNILVSQMKKMLKVVDGVW